MIQFLCRYTAVAVVLLVSGCVDASERDVTAGANVDHFSSRRADSLPDEDVLDSSAGDIADPFESVDTPMTVAFAAGKLHVFLRSAEGNDPLFTLAFGQVQEVRADGGAVLGRSMKISEAAAGDLAQLTAERGVVGGASALITRLSMPYSFAEACGADEDRSHKTGKSGKTGKGTAVVSVGADDGIKDGAEHVTSPDEGDDDGLSGVGSDAPSGGGDDGLAGIENDTLPVEGDDDGLSGINGDTPPAEGDDGTDNELAGEGNDSNTTGQPEQTEGDDAGNISSSEGSAESRSGEISIVAFVFLEDAKVEYGSETIEVSRGQMKFNIESAKWPFCGADHGLLVGMAVELKDTRNEAKYFGVPTSEDSANRTIKAVPLKSEKHVHRGKVLVADSGSREVFMDMPTFALADGVERNCSVDLDETDGKLGINFVLPHFSNTLVYDPTGGPVDPTVSRDIDANDDSEEDSFNLGDSRALRGVSSTGWGRAIFAVSTTLTLATTLGAPM